MSSDLCSVSVFLSRQIIFRINISLKVNPIIAHPLNELIFHTYIYILKFHSNVKKKIISVFHISFDFRKKFGYTWPMITFEIRKKLGEQRDETINPA